jgi:hypothetical protein
MGTFIEEHFELIVLILFFCVMIMLLVIVSFNRYFIRYFSNKKFQISTTYTLNALDKKQNFAITIYNKNINDVRLSGFGYVYKHQNIDFYHSYLNENGLPDDYKIVIPSRDYLSAKVDVDHLKVIVSDINKGTNKTTRIKAFVTDSLGLTTQTRAKPIQKQIQQILTADYLENQQRRRKQRRILKADQARVMRNKRLERNLKRKEQLAKVFLKVRGLFGKRHKKHTSQSMPE